MNPGAAITTHGPTVSKSDLSMFFMWLSLNGLDTSIKSKRREKERKKESQRRRRKSNAITKEVS